MPRPDTLKAVYLRKFEFEVTESPNRFIEILLSLLMSFRSKSSDICNLFIINSWIFTYFISRLVWNANYCFL